jgi:hypothetical protein
MKSFNKYFSGIFLTGILSIAAVSTASAQHGGGGGGHASFGGGGGAHAGFGGSAGGYHNASVQSYSANGFHGATVTGVHGVSSYHAGGFYRPGFGYYGYPQLGFYCGVLPFGYYPFYWGDNLFYYNAGIFYAPYDGGGYEVVTPPVGAAVPNIPDGAKPIKINGDQFYELNGVYYKAVVNDAGKTMYQVAGRDGVLNTDDNGGVGPDDSAPKVGDIVNELPDGCRKITLNGKKYFVSPNDIYYQTFVDQNGNVGYKIASIPSDDDQQ